MSRLHGLLVVGIVFATGYGALYEADDDYNPDREMWIAGVPIRFISLMIVSFGSVAILAFVFTAPDTFRTAGDRPGATIRAISVGSIFSVVGAATADTVF